MHWYIMVLVTISIIGSHTSIFAMDSDEWTSKQQRREEKYNRCLHELSEKAKKMSDQELEKKLNHLYSEEKNLSFELPTQEKQEMQQSTWRAIRMLETMIDERNKKKMKRLSIE